MRSPVDLLCTHMWTPLENWWGSSETPICSSRSCSRCPREGPPCPGKLVLQDPRVRGLVQDFPPSVPEPNCVKGHRDKWDESHLSVSVFLPEERVRHAVSGHESHNSSFCGLLLVFGPRTSRSEEIWPHPLPFRPGPPLGQLYRLSTTLKVEIRTQKSHCPLHCPSLGTFHLPLTISESFPASF